MSFCEAGKLAEWFGCAILQFATQRGMVMGWNAAGGPMAKIKRLCEADFSFCGFEAVNELFRFGPVLRLGLVFQLSDSCACLSEQGITIVLLLPCRVP